MKQSPLKLHQKNKKQTKNLGINLTKAVKDLRAESYKTLIMEVETWSHLWDWKNIVKIAMLLNLQV